MRNLITTGVLLAATLTGLACSSPKPAATTEQTPPPASTVAVSKAAGNSAVVGAALGAKFCSDWTDVSAKTPAGGAPPAGAAAAQPAADLKASIEASKASMQALADQAPAEIKPDFQVYAKFWADYATIMAKANYSFLGAAQDPAFLTLMQSSSTSLQTAAQHIQAYMATNCTR